VNDKDYIKIDDLFKGKPELEERIPAGAWNNMQDLLNKAATTRGGNGAGRYGTYALLALLTVGLGASAVTWQRMQSGVTSTTETSISSHANIAKTTATVLNNTEAASANNTTAIPQDNIAVENELSSYTPEATTGAKSGKHTIAARGTIKQSANIDKRKSTQNNQPQASAVANIVTKKSSSKAGTNTNYDNNKSSAALLAAIQSQQPSAESFAPANITAQTEIALQNIDKAKYKPTAEEDTKFEAVVIDPATNAKYVAPKNEPNWKKEVVDNVNYVKEQYVVVKDEQGVVKRLKDTVEKYSYTRTILVPLSQQDKSNLVALTSAVPKAMPIDLQRVNSMNDAALAVAGTAASHLASSTLVPLESYKVKSIEKKASFASRFYDMMSTYLNGQQPFYFGASIGVQNYFSTPMQTGFHIGLGGYYEFKERFTLGAEVKYIYNQYGPQKVNDSYNQFSNHSLDQSGTKPVYSATAQKFTDIYTLKSNSYWEVPVTLRYQLSKLSIMGGLFANYMTGTKYSLQAQQKEGGASQVFGNTQFKDEQPSVTAKDFTSRMGMGMTLGASYDFSKRVSLDFRLNQNLWNNQKGTSALSENLYRATGAQLSLFYFIGKKDKVIYMMKSK
jgi:RecA/RadA recombinase